MKKFLNKIRKNEAGATAIEYGLIASLIAVVLITILTSLGGNLNTTFLKVSEGVAAGNAKAPATAR